MKLINMKEVIDYLKRIQYNIELISKLRTEHKLMINILETQELITDNRAKELRNTNAKLYEAIIFFESLK